MRSNGSKIHVNSLVDLVKTAVKIAQESQEPIDIKMTTMDKVKKTLKKDADPCSLVVSSHIYLVSIDI